MNAADPAIDSVARPKPIVSAGHQPAAAIVHCELVMTQAI
jgi:hypothetical protein